MMRNSCHAALCGISFAISVTVAATFAGASSARAEVSSAPAAQTGYRIHAGDQLTVAVLGVDALSRDVTVLGDGTITYAIAGTLPAAGYRPDELAQTIARKLRGYVRAPVVTVAVTRPIAFNVLVLGNVKAPGRYPLDRPARVSDAVAAAGGLGAFDGDPPDMRISSADGTLRTVPLKRLFVDGDPAFDVSLAAGDALYIPGPSTFMVEVTGSVARSGEVQLHAGDRLSIAVAKAGVGATEQSDLNHVFVTRTLENGKTWSFETNLYESLQNGNSANDIALVKGDVVYVPKDKYAYGHAASDGTSFLSTLRALFLHF